MGKILLLINNRYFSKMVLENSGNKSSALGLQYEPENLDSFPNRSKGFGVVCPPQWGRIGNFTREGGDFFTR